MIKNELKKNLRKRGIKIFKKAKASYIKRSDLARALGDYKDDIKTKGDDTLTEIFYRDHKIGEIAAPSSENDNYLETIYKEIDDYMSGHSSDWASDAESMEEAVEDVLKTLKDPSERRWFEDYDDEINELEEE